MGLQYSLNLNIASCFINTLASPHANTWYHRGGPITQTIDNFGLNLDHWRSVEHTWKTVIGFIDQGLKYIEINVTKNHVRPYLLSSYYEINLLEYSIQNLLGLCYIIILINSHLRTHGENAVSRPAVNLAFWMLQPKITKIQKIQQGTKNEGNCKYSRYRQLKQRLIMLNRLPEDK